MSWTHQAYVIHDLAKSWDKSTRVSTKEWWLPQVLTWLSWVVTFGTHSKESIRRKYAVTCGPCVMIPKEYSLAQAERVLSHEVLGHVRQFRRCGLGIHPWLGLPLMFVLYVLILFPVFGAIGRYFLELHADSAKWRFMLREQWEMDGTFGFKDVMIRAVRFGALVCGSSYAWAIPAWLGVWGFNQAASDLCQEFARLPKDPESCEAWVRNG